MKPCLLQNSNKILKQIKRRFELDQIYQPLNWATLHWVEQQRTVGNEEAASGSCCALPGSWMLGPGSWGAGCNSRAGRYCQGTTLLWCIYELALFAITMSPLHSSEAVNKRTKIPLPVKFPYEFCTLFFVFIYIILCVCVSIFPCCEHFWTIICLSFSCPHFKLNSIHVPPPQWDLLQQSSWSLSDCFHVCALTS